MKSLSTAELLYLFYAFAYLEDSSHSVTQSTVKRYLPQPYSDKADEVCESLIERQLLESPKFRRVAISKVGQKTLVSNLQTTHYRFKTNKGYRVLNALILCLQMASSTDNECSVDIQFEDFVMYFKELYFTERKSQASQGTYIIREEKMLEDFKKNYPISEKELETYYSRLQQEGLISVFSGREEKNIQWID